MKPELLAIMEKCWLVDTKKRPLLSNVADTLKQFCIHSILPLDNSKIINREDEIKMKAAAQKKSSERRSNGRSQSSKTAENTTKSKSKSRILKPFNPSKLPLLKGLSEKVRFICTKDDCPEGNGIRTFSVISAHEHMGYHVWNDTGLVHHFSSFCVCNAYFLSHASAAEHLAFQTTGYHRIQPLVLPFHPGVQYSEELCHSVEFRGTKLLREYIQEYLVVDNGDFSHDRRGNDTGIGDRVNRRPEIGYSQAREHRGPKIASPDFSHRTAHMYDNAKHGYDNHRRSVEQRGQRLPVITSAELRNANRQDERRPIYENEYLREPLGARRPLVTTSLEYSNRTVDHYSGGPEHGGSRIRESSPTFSNENQLNNFRTSNRNTSNSEERPVPPTFPQTQFKRTRSSSVEILNNCQARDSSSAKKAKDVTIGKAQSPLDEERASHAQVAASGTDGECSVIDNNSYNLSYPASMESMKKDGTPAEVGAEKKIETADSATASGRCRKTAINPRIPVNSRAGGTKLIDITEITPKMSPVDAVTPTPAKKRRGGPPKFK